MNMDWQRGHATMGTVMTAARFIRNFRLYIQGHSWDQEFTNEVMFVICDPQNHPPLTPEQFKKWSEILPL